MLNTNFTNSTGMHSNDNYSTAYDLAILSQYLINEFQSIIIYLPKPNLNGLE